MNRAQLEPKSLMGVAATFRLFDVGASADKTKWKADWRKVLQRFNVLQFAGAPDFVSSSGLMEGAYGSMLMPEAAKPGGPQPDTPSELDNLLEFVDVSLRDFVRAVTRAGKELPEAGFEFPGKDGEIVATAELAWAGAKIAVLLDHEWELRLHFEHAGWTVCETAFAEAFIGQLPGAKS